jgi:hypothetical protein
MVTKGVNKCFYPWAMNGSIFLMPTLPNGSNLPRYGFPYSKNESCHFDDTLLE